MDIEDVIQKVVDNGSVEDMHKLSDILEDSLEMLEKYDKECYKKYEMDLYKMAYGSVLSEEMAQEIVSKMRPYRMRWSIEETQEVQNQFGLDNIRPVDFFVVMNQAYNDYKDLFNENIEMYARYANDFIKMQKKIKYFYILLKYPKIRKELNYE